MQFLVEYSWNLFIGLEIVALIFLLVFMGVRYLFSLRKVSNVFLSLFILMMVLEGLLAFLVFKETGEVATFQIVIVIFLVYAATFGISDFKKLDYTARMKIGKWRQVQLVTDDEKERMRQLKHPKVVAKRARIWFYAHSVILFSALVYLWLTYGSTEYHWSYFIQHRDWFGDEGLQQPFTSEMVNQVIRIWLIIYVVDTIVNWSYTLFPNKEKADN